MQTDGVGVGVGDGRSAGVMETDGVYQVGL